MADDENAVDSAKEVATAEVTVGEGLMILGAVLAALKVLADSAEALPLGYETELDNLIETLFTPLAWASDVIFE